ncbi:maleylpyruvate isomerase N-terminal domain-containing protein [Glycomyces harbinensis]|uniref:Mycothiol maleylpyruvate isomerase N-terminal domain-containing protein n=1 Tax=Glycomyces harbinensis TaxID=58114 RepID=A0A1G6RAK8_9ACTN|nr:maleylpyruvate isomerase N-terminal domain-containing protein [Glycomyces harbinensis]SDD01652.1 Mycothiol maleylpyruvate isomerase N-terminal domain-containing protein [Glycomyces harbinensis]
MIRTHYLSAARTGLDLLAHDAVAASWTEPSALEGFTVGGLAAHLAQQITTVAAALDADHAGKEVVELFAHYDRAAWLGTDIDDDYNTAIRAGGEQGAEAGHAAVLADAATAFATLTAALPARPPGTLSGHARWPYAMALSNLLRTRILELVVHADDLAVSVRVATPDFDEGPFEIAGVILTRLAARRHGQAALVRALARSERAPTTISGL